MSAPYRLPYLVVPWLYAADARCGGDEYRCGQRGGDTDFYGGYPRKAVPRRVSKGTVLDCLARCTPHHFKML